MLDIWKRQKANNEPLTVTNPNMSRFFMTIDQAIDLVLYAIKNGTNKDLWVYNNKSCTIKELADCISENQIEVGLRCIEKNLEELLTINELNHSELINNIYYRVNNTIKTSNNYKKPFKSDNCKKFDIKELKNMISKL